MSVTPKRLPFLVSFSGFIPIILWILSSCLLSTYANTTFLNFFGNLPLTLTLIRFVGSLIVGTISYIILPQTMEINVSNEVKVSQIPYLIKCLIIPSITLLIANSFNSFALSNTGITITYIIKGCGIPLVTVLITTLFMGTRYRLIVYVSLIPTIVGIVLTSYGDMELQLNGIIYAIISTISQVIMNISGSVIIKKYASKNIINGKQAQYIMVTTCLFIVIPLHILNINNETLIIPKDENLFYSLFLICITALAYHIEYSLNCVILGILTPLQFAFCDIGRRLGIIIAGLFLFNKSLSLLNDFGLILALGGVFFYTNIKDKIITPNGDNNLTSDKDEKKEY